MPDLEIPLDTPLGVRDDDPADSEGLVRIVDPPPRPPGPDRATVWVPTQETLLNLGEAYPGPHAAPLDRGIAGRTASHVHVHAMGGADGEADPTRTLVRAGGPARIEFPAKSEGEYAIEAEIARLSRIADEKDAALGVSLGIAAAARVSSFEERSRINELKGRLLWLEERRARQSEAKGAIGTVFSPPHQTWHGYSMVTRGGAVHEARHNHLVVSGEGDLRLAGQRSVSIGSSGDVVIAVHQGAETVEFCRNSGGDQNDAAAPGPGKMHRDTVDIVNAAATMISSGLSTWYTIMDLVQGYNKKPSALEAGWVGPNWMDYASTVVSGALALVGPVLVGAGPLMDSPGGRLDLFSSDSVSIVGQMSASLHGLRNTSVASPGATLVSGGAVLSLSSNAMASLSAPRVGITAVAQLALESTVGTFTARARSTMELSTHANTLIAANDDVQITSTEGRATMFGHQGFFLAAGGGAKTGPNTRYAHVQYAADDGYGVHGTKTDLFMGKLVTANKSFDSPARGTSYFAKIDDQRIELTHEQSHVRVEPSKVEVSASTFEVMTDGEVTISGSRILLG